MRSLPSGNMPGKVAAGGESRSGLAPGGPQNGHTSDSRFSAILDLSDDAILTIDLSGVIVGWNRGAERIYGYPAEVILGNPVSVLVPPDRSDEWGLVLRL